MFDYKTSILGPKRGLGAPTLIGLLTSLMNSTVVSLFVVGLTLTHHDYNAVRGHRKGTNNSGAEDYFRKETNKTEKIYTQ